MEFLQGALGYVSDVLSYLYALITSLDTLVANVFAYAGYWLFSLWLDTKAFMYTLALKFAQLMLADYGIYTLIEENFNGLPNDVKYILNTYGITTGLRMIFDAFATSFVLRFLGW